MDNTDRLEWVGLIFNLIWKPLWNDLVECELEGLKDSHNIVSHLKSTIRGFMLLGE